MTSNKQTGQNLYNTAKKLIPGGTMLLSKRPEMFLPDKWPAYFSKAKGFLILNLKRLHENIGISIEGIDLSNLDSDTFQKIK